ncbi:MAG: hypothetical protein M1546_08970 [Chloroflexi bacterium]|nr:hypothetical protein [Chloroflexota bacterium]
MTDSGSGQDGGQTPDGGAEIGEVCIANISPYERRKRLVSGVILFVTGFVILGALMAAGVNRWWRLPLLLLFWSAASGVFQWLDKT